MPNYSKGKIYKIYSSKDPTLCYYGSTTEHYISSRFAKHFYKYKMGILEKENCASRLVFDAGDYKCSVVEEYPCSNKQELCLREQFYIKNNPCVNIQKAFATEEDKKKDKSIQDKKYRETHDVPEHIKLRKAEKRAEKINCPVCNMEISRGCFTRHKKRWGCI